MQGILIIGDVRLHFVSADREASNLSPKRQGEFGAKQTCVTSWVFGGTHMLADLVHLALFDLSRDSDAPYFFPILPHQKRIFNLVSGGIIRGP